MISARDERGNGRYSLPGPHLLRCMSYLWEAGNGNGNHKYGMAAVFTGSDRLSSLPFFLTETTCFIPRNRTNRSVIGPSPPEYAWIPVTLSTPPAFPSVVLPSWQLQLTPPVAPPHVVLLSCPPLCWTYVWLRFMSILSCFKPITYVWSMLCGLLGMLFSFLYKMAWQFVDHSLSDRIQHSRNIGAVFVSGNITFDLDCFWSIHPSLQQRGESHKLVIVC